MATVVCDTTPTPTTTTTTTTTTTITVRKDDDTLPALLNLISFTVFKDENLPFVWNKVVMQPSPFAKRVNSWECVATDDDH